MTSTPATTNLEPCTSNQMTTSQSAAIAAGDTANDIENNIENDKSAPIGLFDSGVGGLSVYMHLKQVLPNERYVYYADTLNVPYGSRSSAEIQQLTLTAVKWLVDAGCKIIVIACNSASAHALQVAREYYPDVPIVGLVPALKPAVMSSRSKNVAVLATKATLDGKLLNTVIDDYAAPAGVEVVKWFDSNLVPWVESGMPTDSATAQQLKEQLQDFANRKVDYLVLGCTHYPFFREFASQAIAERGLDMTVIDSGAAIASRVKEVLAAADKLAAVQSKNEIEQSSLYVGVIAAEQGDQAASTTALAAVQRQEKLAFYVTDDKADSNEVAKLVKRLIYSV